jgi:glycosyltransferase involved in cell wall biosynthesis
VPKSRLKVVHLVVAANIGGAEHFVANLASRAELSNADHCIALMTANAALKELFRTTGLAVVDRGLVREPPFWNFRRIFGAEDLAWLIDVISKENASVLHAHTYGSHVLSVRAAKAAGIPCVRTEHGFEHLSDIGHAWYRHWALLNTDRVIAVCEYVAKFVKALEPRAAPHVMAILNGIDTVRFQPVPPFEDERLTIAWTARLDPEKQADMAIRAVSRVPNVRLNLAGDGLERQKLEGLVRSLGVGERIHFLGYQDDVRPVIAASHVVINCRRREGLPLALLEAASMERPAIAFKGSGGVAEVIENGKTGLLADECSVEGFAALIAQASRQRELLVRLGKNARADVEKRFTLDGMCRQYGAVYSELSARPRAA